MADAPTAGGAPQAGAAAQPGMPAGNSHPEAKPGETKQQTLQRIRMDLGDGMQEYEEETIRGLAQRGKKSSQILSKAEQRAQEATKLKEEAETRLSRLKSKDLREQRAALKELGLDEFALADAVAREYTEAERLTPEQKRIRELEQKAAEREEADRKAKEEEGKKAEGAETERHREQFSTLFLDVMQRAGLPRESAGMAFPRLATLYQAADVAGVEVDPDVAAERLKDAFRKEHTALYRKKDGTLDLDAFEASLTPEDWKALNRRAVEKFRAARAGGAPVVQPKQPAVEQREEKQTNGARRNFWKTLGT